MSTSSPKSLESQGSGGRTAVDLLVLAILTLLAAQAYVLPSEFVPGRDMSAMHIPYAALLNREGLFPLMWNSYSHCGTPAFANPAFAMLSPLQWAAYFLTPLMAVNLFVAVHLYLYALAAYLWLRAFGSSRSAALLVAGLHLCAMTLVSLLEYGHALMIAGESLSFLAFALLARVAFAGAAAHQETAARRVGRFSLLALLVAWSILGGGIQILHHQFVAMVVLLTLSRLLAGPAVPWWRLMGLITGAHLLGAGLAWVQLGSTFDFLYSSSRAAHFGGLELMGEGALDLSGLVKFLSPLALGLSPHYWGQADFWFAQASHGTLGLLLLLAGLRGLRARPFHLAAGLSALLLLVLALGPATPLYGLYAKVVPMAGLFRFPSRYLYPALFLALPLLASGADHLMRRFGVRQLWTGLGLCTASLLVALAGMSEFVRGLLPAVVANRIPATQAAAPLWVFHGADLGCLLLFALAMVWSRARPVLLLAALLVLVQGRDLFPVNRVPVGDMAMTSHAATSGRARILAENPMERPNAHLLHGIMTPGGYDAFYPAGYRTMLDTFTPQDWRKKTREQLTGLDDEALRLLGVEARLLPGGRFPDGPTRAVLPPGRLYWLTTTVPLPPRRESPHYARVEARQLEIRAALGEAGMSPDPGHVRILEYAAERVLLEANAATRCVLASSENDDGRWRCRVDGVEQKILPWLGTFRASILDAGRHQVEFFYDRTPFYRHAGVSAFFLLLLIAANLWARKTSRALT